ncbi:hypothetical protein BamIOP4010DRAFT_6609 [Burkholderia ambifaria IOP40-10]|uniref:Uncharacterized protein n=1 Tax=Burkholderia ambifaria IOP40-10 TaxID=396596 RepID=B1FRE8_9BURK|nr:hypothetical protein BamIOP4010DRAFT_6609 [Burkholderia ambifaria IOP40-10]
MLLETVALVQAERHRHRLVAAELFELFDPVFQDVHRLQARLQVVAALLKARDVVEVGLHVRDELLVADRRPGPAAECEREGRDEAEEGRVAQPGLGRARELAHGLAIREDHLGEQVAQEEAVLRERAVRLRQRARVEAEAVRDALRGGAVGFAFLQRAGEVEAAEDRLVLERVVLEQRREERAQRRLDRREFEREAQLAGRQLVAARQRQLRDADFLQPFVQLLEALVEQRDDVTLLVRLVGQGGAPHAVVLVLVAAAEEFGEAGDQVGLREHHVDRREHLELFRELLNALTEVFREVDRKFGAVAGEFGDARGDDDAVDRRLRTVAFQQAEEAEPFAAVFLVHRVAAGRVEQDPLGREEPVAVARAADAVDHGAVLVRERKLQAGVQHGAALARGRVADHDVPWQFVQRGAARHLADLRRLDRLHRVGQARAQHVEVGGLRVGRERGRGRCGDLAGFRLLFQHLAQLLVRALHAPAAPQRDAEPQHEDRREGERRPQKRQLQHVGDDEENRR